MQTKDLLGVTRLAGKLSNPSSLTSLYKSIEIGPTSVRCCSEFGNIEITVDPTGLENPVLLSCGAVNGVALSLPPGSEIILTETENKVNWKCNNAKGTWNLVASDHKIPKIDHTDFPWIPPTTLGTALELASCACQFAAVSFGLYGITIEADGDKLHLLSSNTISLASATVDKGTFPSKKVTLRPPVPAIIAALIGNCPNCVLDVTDEGVFIKGDWLLAHLPLGSHLDHDLKDTVEKFSEVKHVAKIDSNAVKMFITRAKSLSEKSSSFKVTMKVEEGKLALEHAGISSSTEEWFLADGLDSSLNFNPLSLPADLLMLPLQYVQHAIFDYLPQNNLVMRGTNPDFIYVLSGGDE